MTLPSRISLLTLSLALAACSTPPAPEAGITEPPTWQSRADASSQACRMLTGGKPSPAANCDRLDRRARS